MQTRQRFFLLLSFCVLWLCCFIPTVARATDDTISGTVVDSAGQPLADIPLVLRVLETHPEGHHSWQEEARTVTDQAGRYVFTKPAQPACQATDVQCQIEQQRSQLQPHLDLPTASTPEMWSQSNESETVIYRIDLAPEARQSQLDLTILDDATALRSAQQSAQGQIMGSVTDEVDQPTTQIVVSLYLVTYMDEYGYMVEQLVRRTLTDAAGTYAFDRLSPGDYKVGFTDVFLPERYVAEYYDDANDLWQARVIPINTESVTIDAELTRAGQIMGTVHDTNGQPVGNIDVIPYRLLESSGYYEPLDIRVRTAEDGYYHLNGLPVGRYRLSYEDSEWPRRFIRRYYAHANTMNDAVDIDLQGGEIRRAVDVQLTTGGKARGKITNVAGQPLADISVNFYYRQYYERNGQQEWYWEQLQSVLTNADGTYEVATLPGGTYMAGFTDYTWPQRYQQQYYDNIQSFDKATTFEVQEGAITTGIDAVLAPVARIQGRVTLANGQPVGYANVIVFTQQDDGNWYPINSSITNGNGDYELNGLSSGTYRIGFMFANRIWPTLFYNQATRVEAAADISVTAGETVTGINGAFPTPGAISGQVTDGTGTPLARIPVTALYSASFMGYDVGWVDLPTTYTDENGRYMLQSLLPDTYLVRFEYMTGEERSYSMRYYGDNSGSSTDLNAAARIQVTENTLTDNINGSLLRTGTISGRVTDANNVPIAYIRIEARQQAKDYQGNDYWSYSGYAYTDDQGYYTVRGLNAGQHRITFWDNQWPWRYVQEYYNDVTAFDAAQLIGVAAGEDVTGIDAQLSTGGQISGQITTDTNASVLTRDNTGVQLYRAHVNETGETTWEYLYSNPSTIAEDGTYTITVLPAGRYRLRVDNWTGEFEPTFYGNVTDIEEATDILLSKEETVTGIDVQLIASEPTTTTLRTGPIAHNDVISITTATTLTQQVLVTGTVLLNDLASEAENRNQTLSAELVTNATFGTVELQPDGQFTYTPTGPTANTPGVDAFTYRVTDGEGSSNTAIVFILLPEGNRNGARKILLPLLVNQ